MRLVYLRCSLFICDLLFDFQMREARGNQRNYFHTMHIQKVIHDIVKYFYPVWDILRIFCSTEGGLSHFSIHIKKQKHIYVIMKLKKSTLRLTKQAGGSLHASVIDSKVAGWLCVLPQHLHVVEDLVVATGSQSPPQGPAQQTRRGVAL